MGQFVSQSKTLKGVLWAVESRVPLFDTFTKAFKRHLLLMYCIKNQSIGVSEGALLNIFWIFEYVSSRLFAGPLSVDFTHVKKVQQRFSAICILNFKPKTSIKV